jgi:cell wall-associated NlpC family hydrolase
MHWCSKYLLLPYCSGGRDWKGVDCWGLLYLVYWNEFGIKLPIYPGLNVEDVREVSHRILQEVQQGWTIQAQPKEGYAVGMSQSKQLHHVGIYIEASRGKILHTWNRQVRLDDWYGLHLLGIHTIQYYRHHLYDLCHRIPESV